MNEPELPKEPAAPPAGPPTPAAEPFIATFRGLGARIKEHKVVQWTLAYLAIVYTLRFNQYVNTSRNLWERAFYDHQDGLLDDEGWAAWDAYFRDRMQRGFGWPNGKPDDSWQRVWSVSGKTGYGEALRRHVNSALTN